jgi:hypothetical protein
VSEPSWPELLGRKVSLRFRLHGDPGHPFSEAIGVVMSVRGEGPDRVLTILDRQGKRVEVRADDVLARKVFPL